jgi:hypothetical protein
MIQEEHLKQEKEVLLKKLDLINHNLQKLKSLDVIRKDLSRISESYLEPHGLKIVQSEDLTVCSINVVSDNTILHIMYDFNLHNYKDKLSDIISLIGKLVRFKNQYLEIKEKLQDSKLEIHSLDFDNRRIHLIEQNNNYTLKLIINLKNDTVSAHVVTKLHEVDTKSIVVKSKGREIKVKYDLRQDKQYYAKPTLSQKFSTKFDYFEIKNIEMYRRELLEAKEKIGFTKLK